MRRLLLTLLCGLTIVPTAFAASRATGDGVLELRNVDAQWALIRGAHGAIWGQLDRGTLTVTDLDPTDNNVPQVSGAEQTTVTPDPATVVYSGTNIHFRFSGGRYKFTFAAVGIDLTAVGVGTVKLVGDPRTADDGDYALDGGKWLPVAPAVPKTIAFGVQPSAGP